MPTLEGAIITATAAHRLQTTFDGQPYILHPLRVMLSFKDPQETNERIVAVLHDVAEDTKITLAVLKGAGYSPVILSALDAISWRKGEEYTDYITRVSQNELASRVKIADLRDNTDPNRPNVEAFFAAHPKKRSQYLEALRFLSS